MDEGFLYPKWNSGNYIGIRRFFIEEPPIPGFTGVVPEEIAGGILTRLERIFPADPCRSRDAKPTLPLF
jgi:hypothetical protein